MKYSPEAYTVAVNLYGQRPASTPDEDVPCHVGFAIYETLPGSQLPAACALHQIRAPVGDVYAYENRPEQPLSNDPLLNTSCVLRSDLTVADIEGTAEVVQAFGNDPANIPEWGVGNCQDWLAGAVEAVEVAGFVPRGDGKFWRTAVGKGRAQTEDNWKALGRQVRDGPAKSFVRGSVAADARWSDQEIRQIRKLDLPADFDAALSARFGK